MMILTEHLSKSISKRMEIVKTRPGRGFLNNEIVIYIKSFGT